MGPARVIGGGTEGEKRPAVSADGGRERKCLKCLKNEGQKEEEDCRGCGGTGRGRKES